MPSIAKVSVACLVVSMVCLQRFLTQSLSCEPQHFRMGTCFPTLNEHFRYRKTQTMSDISSSDLPHYCATPSDSAMSTTCVPHTVVLVEHCMHIGMQHPVMLVLGNDDLRKRIAFHSKPLNRRGLEVEMTIYGAI
jgi:hypothetical protein